MTVLIWRFLVALFDMAWWRKITGRSVFDFVFISNMRDEIDADRFRGKWNPKNGHFIGPRFRLKNVYGCIRFLDIKTEALMTPNGRRLAQKQFLSAVEWADKKGVKAVLFAAGLKRIFEGASLARLKEQYPSIVFTIGDNGTAVMLMKDVLDGIKKTGLGYDCKIGIIGPSGHLGKAVVNFLIKLGYHTRGISAHKKRSQQMTKEYGILVYDTLKEMGKVDLIVACNHSAEVKLKADDVKEKLVVIDVCVPENFSKVEYDKCENVYRIDAGLAYNPSLKYILGRLSYERLRMSNGLVFGCFAETISIADAFRNGCVNVLELKQIDWHNVNDKNIVASKRLLDLSGFTNSPPRSFGKLL